MALNGFLDIELSVKNPAELGAFWERHGLLRTTDGVYGTTDRSTIMTIKEGDHRHLSAMHLSCAHESDIADIARRLESLGVASRTTSTTLDRTDPVLGHSIRIEVTSSDMDRYARNQNVADAPGTTANVAIAEQTIHHGGAMLSRLELPLIPVG